MGLFEKRLLPWHIRKAKFRQKEIRIGIVFFLVVFCIEFLPAFFSFSGKSAFYEKYYADSVTFTFVHLMLIAYFSRLVFVCLRFYGSRDD